MPTPPIREVGSNSTTTTATCAVTTSSAVAVNDTLVCFQTQDYNVPAGTAPNAVSGASAWTRRPTAGYLAPAAGQPSIEIWTCTVTSGGAKTVTINGTSGDFLTNTTFVLVGVVTINGTSAGTLTKASSTSSVAPSVTPINADDLLLTCYANLSFGSSATTYTPPSTSPVTTSRSSIVSGTNGAMLTTSQPLASAAATGTRTATNATADQGWAAAQLTFAGAAAAAFPPPRRRGPNYRR